ncbi:hypothetical protein ABEB36_003703 [Hypothenemus hampei]|uniref:Protein-lysine N-methyltransferase ABEB36_003703 n=1 Tax=Hypothenemus hampei TaxID=57062 RepID=A0ABD1F0U6_HYPHA
MLNDELDSSELGTLEYWEQRYKNEIKNYSDYGDTGDVWFGEDIVERIINWLTKNIAKTSKIADIGCGNGHILTELARLDYKDLTGLDYSQTAIDLAQAIAQEQKLSIKYEVTDILEGLKATYNVIHDKGTYDAVSLSTNSKESCMKYMINVHEALRPDGYFIITSCNWTENELKDHFKQYFLIHQTISTPQFKFGGKVGNVVSICVFVKK